MRNKGSGILSAQGVREGVGGEETGCCDRKDKQRVDLRGVAEEMNDFMQLPEG